MIDSEHFKLGRLSGSTSNILFPHFMDGKGEAQRRMGICPKPHNAVSDKQGTETQAPACLCRALGFLVLISLGCFIEGVWPAGDGEGRAANTSAGLTRRCEFPQGV